MPGQNSFPKCWRKQLRPARPAAAQVIHLHGIPAQLSRRSRLRILRRTSAARFPALSHRLPLLLDRLRVPVAAVRPVAVVVAEAAEVGKPLTAAIRR